MRKLLLFHLIFPSFSIKCDKMFTRVFNNGFFIHISLYSVRASSRPVGSVQRSSSGSGGHHVTHLHISPQFLKLIQPDLLLLGQTVTGPLHLHQLHQKEEFISRFLPLCLSENGDLTL